MSIIPIEDLNRLIEHESKPCISLYMPTHRAGTQVRQDPIRMKNLLRRAQRQLEELGVREPQMLLQPAVDLFENDYFWLHQHDGLVVFLSPELFLYYKVPYAFEESLTVAPRFHLKPVLPLITTDGHYYLLALGQKRLRFYHGTRFTINELDLESLPAGIAEILQYWDKEEAFFYHHDTATSAVTAGNRRQGQFPGHGSGPEEANRLQSAVADYFRRVDRGLRDYLGLRHAPLVLAGLAHLLPVYRGANTYPHLLERSIVKDGEALEPEELHRLAWELIEPVFHAKRDEAVRRFDNQQGTGLVSTSLEEVVPAAWYGRVDTLFIDPARQLWGSFSASDSRIELHAQAREDDLDLLDFAAVNALRREGQVFELTGPMRERGYQLAAVFRY